MLTRLLLLVTELHIQNYFTISFIYYRLTDDTANPKTYQAVLTVVGFTADHSGIYTVAIENRAGIITEQFERRVEG